MKLRYTVKNCISLKAQNDNAYVTDWQQNPPKQNAILIVKRILRSAAIKIALILTLALLAGVLLREPVYTVGVLVYRFIK